MTVSVVAVRAFPETPQSKTESPALHPVRYILAMVVLSDLRGGLMETSEIALEF